MAPLYQKAWVWVLACVATSITSVSASPSSSCPSVCACRWKNGKRAVECRDAGLASVPAGVDSDTQVLDLTGNNLQSLPRHVFKRLALINLQKIYLRDCKIGRVDPTAFSQLTNLVELDLRDNLLTDVPAVAFSHTHALRDLYLGGNRLRRIHRDSFTHTASLVRLDLSYAGIRSIEEGALEPLSLLEKIDLQGNQLSQLPATAVQSLERVHSLKVHDNPWLCDCRVLPLWRLLERRHVSHPVSPSCRSPQRVAGDTFDRLAEEDFACPPSILPIVRGVHGVAGENTSVSCPVEGQPTPQVTWYKDGTPIANGSVLGLGPQRVYIITEHYRNTESRLVITGAQENDSGTLQCVASNSAGEASANFTLTVKMRAAAEARLDSSHIAGISVGLVVVALVVLVVGFFVLTRTRSHASQTPVKNSSRRNSSCAASPNEPNPVQKPPRLTDVNASSGTLGSALSNPDVINEAERVVRAVNGHIPNGAPGEGGDYTRVEGDSLYPSGLWLEDSHPQDANDPPIHEHFNPGYMPNDLPFDPYGPVHSTPYQANYKSQNFDPQTYGYPADYGLPIPEADPDLQGTPHNKDWSLSDLREPQDGGDPMYVTRHDMYTPKLDTNMRNSTQDIYGSSCLPLYSSRQDIYASNQDSDIKHSSHDVYGIGTSRPQPAPNPDSAMTSSSQGVYGLSTSRPPVYGHRSEVYGSREDAAEGAESPRSPTEPLGERPWVPGSQAPPHARGGVPVLPPLPNGMINRIKARDSPDEGYQEGTEV